MKKLTPFFALLLFLACLLFLCGRERLIVLEKQAVEARCQYHSEKEFAGYEPSQSAYIFRESCPGTILANWIIDCDKGRSINFPQVDVGDKINIVLGPQIPRAGFLQSNGHSELKIENTGLTPRAFYIDGAPMLAFPGCELTFEKFGWFYGEEWLYGTVSNAL